MSTKTKATTTNVNRETYVFVNVPGLDIVISLTEEAWNKLEEVSNKHGYEPLHILSKLIQARGYIRFINEQNKTLLEDFVENEMEG